MRIKWIKALDIEVEDVINVSEFFPALEGTKHEWLTVTSIIPGTTDAAPHYMNLTFKFAERDTTLTVLAAKMIDALA